MKLYTDSESVTLDNLHNKISASLLFDLDPGSVTHINHDDLELDPQMVAEHPFMVGVKPVETKCPEGVQKCHSIERAL